MFVHLINWTFSVVDIWHGKKEKKEQRNVRLFAGINPFISIYPHLISCAALETMHTQNIIIACDYTKFNRNIIV